MPEEAHFLLYGPGFEVRITRTDPATDYPFAVAADHSMTTLMPL